MKLGLRNLSVKIKMVAPVALLGIAVAVSVAWCIIRLTTAQAVERSLETAKSLSAQVSEMRAYYTKNVVARARAAGMKATPEYASQAGAIPLPATMVHELNETLSRKEGIRLRLYSEYPFPFFARTAGRTTNLSATPSNSSAPTRRRFSGGRTIIKACRPSATPSRT